MAARPPTRPPVRPPVRPPDTGAPADSRQRVLDAAAELFLGQGFAATAFDQVRQAAGVSNGSLYHHFSSKAELARALYLQALASYHAAMQPALQAQPAAADGVRALVHQHLVWVQRHPREARVLHRLRDAAGSDGQPPDWAGANAPAFDALRAWIAAEVAAGRMHELPFDAWLALVFSPLLQLGEAWLRRDPVRVPPSLRDALADAAVRAVAVAAPATHPLSTQAAPRRAARRP